MHVSPWGLAGPRTRIEHRNTYVHASPEPRWSYIMGCHPIKRVEEYAASSDTRGCVD